MRRILARVLITAFGLWIADALLRGVYVDSVWTLWLAALLLGVVNAILRPIIIVLTLPITFLTFGLFLLIINGAMVVLVAYLVPSFHITSIGTGVLAAIIVGITGWIANGVTAEGEQGRRRGS
jgi:putative membrane protein